jgi:amino acid adenylation domain-containing protein
MSEMEDSSRTTSGLSPAKLALLEKLRRGVRVTAPPLSVRKGTGPMPLSFGQLGLWFLHKLQPDIPVYNECFAARMGGRLNVVALGQAMRQIIRRHESLRTSFPEVNGQPIQNINGDAGDLRLIDVTGLSEAGRLVEAERLLSLEARAPFDLSDGPLIRITLLRLSQEGDDHILVLTFHHIVSDGYSYAVLLREMSALYREFSSEGPSGLTELPVQYADFAEWQRKKCVEGDAATRDIEYWKEQLGSSSVLFLPTDRPRPPRQTFNGSIVRQVVPSPLLEPLKELGKQTNTTLFMLFLGAFKTLLYRYTGQSDIAIGVPMAGRQSPELEALIGYFINTLVLRSDLSGNPTLEELLFRVRDVCLGAFSHQDLPFEEVVKELSPDRSVSRTPLFTISLVLQGEMPQPEFAGLDVRLLNVHTSTAKFDLSLSLTETDRGLKADWEYNTDLFDRAKIWYMAEHFRTVLEAFAEHFTDRLGSFPIITECERHQILAEWNHARVPFASHSQIDGLVHAQATHSPDAVGVACENRFISYHELDARAARLASYLGTLGVGPEVRVGICTPRTEMTVVGMLGVLKAGGAYVGLDPTYPRERLAFMIEDSMVKVLLAAKRNEGLFTGGQAHLVLLDDDWPVIEREEAPFEAVASDGGNLAYVIYTSGSTGKPKGVGIEHHSAVTLLNWAKTVFGTKQLEGVLASTSISFDLSVFEIFVPLSRGGTVIMADNALSLGAMVDAERVTLINTVPSAMQGLLRAKAIPQSVRTVNLAGEALQAALVEQVYGETAVATVLNLYGPSEDTTYSTYMPIDRVSRTPPPIGRQVANTDIFILDEEQAPVPIGLQGEICIGGDGLARGYLNRAEITAERFIPNSFGAVEEGSRIYRTGDLGRYLRDGNIEYLGRLDYQVKVRGYRIELEEIQAVLRQYPGVGQAMVMVRSHANDARLIAYIATQSPSAVSSSELRLFLRQKLPDYMIPAEFAVVEFFPLTPNGKIDRRALDKIGSFSNGRASVFGPVTPTQQLILNLYTEFFPKDNITINDDFFQLGGHSLLAIQAVHRLEALFDRKISPHIIFESPAVADLAQSIDQMLIEEVNERMAGYPPLEAVERGGAIALSHMQQGLWLLDRLQLDSALYNIAGAIALEGRMDAVALEHSINETVRRHETLRTIFPSGDVPEQTILPRVRLTLDLVDLSGIDGARLELIISELAGQEVSIPFDLGVPPLLRVRLLRVSETRHVLLVTMHHIISDAWSTGILVKQVGELYERYCEGAPSQLEELRIQYADYSSWQNGLLNGGYVEPQLQYWKGQLSGLEPILEMPTDKLRPAVQSHSGGSQAVVIDGELTAKLREKSRGGGYTLFTTLLAAFEMLLARYSGNDDLAVGVPVANRTRKEIEALIGFFVNVVVIRSDFSGYPGLEEGIARVKKAALEAFENQEAPFDKVVEENQPERNLSHHPIFQVMFAYNPGAIGEDMIGGLRLSTIPIGSRTSKFDLDLLLEESGNEIRGRIEYSTDLFDAGTIERLAGCYQRFLEEAVANPERRFAEVELVSGAARRQVLVDWNNTETEYESELVMHGLLEKQVWESPDGIAAVSEGKAITYSKLNELSNQLADELRGMGIGPEEVVGIAVERSLELLTGYLGILKAGGSILPLDPTYPKERLRYMMEDAESRVMLSQQAYQEGLGDLATTVICLDSDRAGIGRDVDQGPVNEVSEESLGYIIYTSGSTGEPKGVAVSHGSASNHLLWRQQTYPLTAWDRFLQKAAITFDISIWEIFGTIVAGATLVMARAGAQGDPDYLVEVIREENVTVAHFGPSILNAMLGEAEFGGCKSLRRVFCGGEAMTPELRRRFQAQSKAELTNQYGPTEGTIDVATWDCGEERGEERVPIGGPIANTMLYVCDRYLEPVPAGMIGEIHIGGKSLARGYVNRGDLTAGSFVCDPYSEEAGGRLYKTADLGRYRGDGAIEYVGRKDQQVKVRGFRIELGEIEAAMERHPGVVQAIVSVRTYGDQDRRLVAHVVREDGVGQEDVGGKVTELREFLMEKLPNYMVPGEIGFLESLPLMASGKVDRGALARMASTSAEGLDSNEPATPMQELICKVYSEVLQKDRVGINESFFELGGHSLLAVQVVSRLQAALHRKIPLRTVFESPSVAQLAESVEIAIRRDEEGAGYQVDGRNQREATYPALEAVGRSGKIALSHMQQRLWLLDRLQPDSSLYNIAGAIVLEGRMDTVALEDSINETVRRHESLRTIFPSGDAPEQAILPSIRVSLDLVDLINMDRGRVESLICELASQEATIPFNLALAPLLRVRLLRVCESKHVLLVTMHHIISDAWSTGVLVKQVAELYEMYSRGGPSGLAELSIQYADYSSWQNGLLSGGYVEPQIQYWKRQLSGLRPILEMPTDRPRPALQSHSGSSQAVIIDPELTAELKARSRAGGYTLFTTLLAAFQILLARYSGEVDIAVGVPVANRTREEIELLIGFFVNVVVIRSDFTGFPALEQALDRVREAALDAFENQEAPFDQVVEEIQPERNLSHHPIFQVMFTFNPGVLAEDSIGGLRLQPVRITSSTAKFDLDLLLEESGNEIAGRIEYSTDLFDAPTIERLAGCFQTFLQAMAANPERRFAEVELVSGVARRQVLADWNNTETAYDSDFLIHHLWDRQVSQGPDAIAVVSDEKAISYRSMNEQANRLASELRRKGIGPEEVVAISVERSLELVAGYLGILKAGASILPLDPSYPKERLRYMLRDAGSRLLLTQQGFKDWLADLAATVICLDGDWAAHALDDGPIYEASPESLGYIIYTSGSTGLPKGVGVSHRSASNHLLWRQAAYPLTDGDRFLQKASITFDISIWEIFGTITAGATLVMAQAGAQGDPDYLIEVIRRENVTIAHFAPAILTAIVAEPQFSRCAGLRRVFCGGEAITPELMRRFQAQSKAELSNQYGPTEGTIDVAIWDCAEDSGGLTVPIGRPIANTTLYVCDRHLEPVPPGIIGEIHIGGTSLARGYVSRGDLTAGSFVCDPFTGGAGGRLYKTADLGRYRGDGVIEYVGRKDQQVKVRGFRIELGEIEAAMEQHPGVVHAIVSVRTNGDQDRRLVAHVVARDWVGQEDVGKVTELRQFLMERLPNYMAPGEIGFLESLPLMANGKVDRRALAGMATTSAERVGSDEPATPMQAWICGVYSEVLQKDHIGINESFFELGGHSLLAVQVVSRLQAALNRKIPLRTVFESPTVAELAQWVEAAIRGDEGGAGYEVNERDDRAATYPPLEAVGRSGAIALSHMQQRLWLLDRLQPDSALYNIAGAIALEGRMDAVALEHSINETVRRHETLRTIFPSGDVPEQTILPRVRLTLDLVDLSGIDGARLELIISELAGQEVSIPFDLGVPPLLRVRLLRVSETRHVLLVTMHHIISDAWSTGILVKQVGELYERYCEGAPSQLEELRIQYADYSSWQNGLLNGGYVEPQLQYWKGQLSGLEPILEMPTDKLRPAVQSHSGGSQAVVIDGELTAKLREKSRGGGYTLFTTLLAAFEMLLARYSGNDDLAVGVPVANRTRKEIEALIGFFVNVVVIRSDFSGYPGLEEGIARVKKAALEAFENQEAPFDKVVEENQPERNLSHHPIFQVMFAYNPGAIGEDMIGGLRLSTIPIGSRTSKFDLDLLLEESGNEIRGRIEYSTDLFDAGTIERLAGCYQRFLEEAVANPERRFAEVELVSGAARRQVLVDWNNTETEYESELVMHGLLEKQVWESPDGIAAVSEGKAITYSKLNELSNQLADELRGMGIGPEEVVGIAVERSLELLTGYLGILKAGGSILPLDPTYPKERLRYMMEDAESRVMLSQQAYQEGLGDLATTVICLDSDRAGIGRDVDQGPVNEVSEESLGYIIYTSGSTGEPKGVAVSHGSASNHLLWRQQTYPLTAWDRFLQKAAITFDISIWEIFGTIVAGATLVMARAGAQGDPDYLVEVIREENVTVAHFGPSILNAMLGEAEFGGCKSLRRVFCGGEAMTPELRRRFQAQSKAELTNQYGPTEGTIDVATWDCGEERGEERVPIGGPIANTMLYVCDRYLEPVPAGMIGEIHIGGKSLARGYVNRGDLTAGSFVCDPYSEEAGGRLYKTADLGRYRGDGAIEYVGRKDQQVKVRGFRIELGEIEAAMERHPGVVQAIVSVRTYGDQDRRLVAHVVREDGVGQEDVGGKVTELREFLMEKLPNYMVPGEIGFLESLPLMASGKVDRGALARMASTSAEGLDSNEPATPMQELICKVYSEVLQKDRVGINESFFELGGHSLLAVQVVSRLQAALHRKIPLRTVFESPSVAQLAESVEVAIRAGGNRATLASGVSKAKGEDIGLRPDTGHAWASISPRKTGRESIPLSYAQLHFWFLDKLQGGGAAYNLPAALRLAGSLNLTTLEGALNEIVRRHESLRTIFPQQDGVAVQEILSYKFSPLTAVDLEGLTGADRDTTTKMLSRQAARRALDLSNGPLLLAEVLRFGPEDHILLITHHHIASDAWSAGILVSEMGSLYNAFLANGQSSLSEPPIQYADFAIWQREVLEGDIIEGQLAFWREQLKGNLPIIQLPSDRPRPSVQTFRGAAEPFTISVGVTQAVRELGRRANATLFMVLLAVFDTLLYRYTRQEDIIVGSPAAYRDRTELEGIIGCVINALVLRVDASGNTTFQDLLVRVRERALAAYAHQDVPFERLVEELQPKRSTSHAPIFQVSFVLQNVFMPDYGLTALRVSPISIPPHAAKFDWILNIAERGDSLTGLLEYSTDMFDASTIARVVNHFGSLLQAVVDASQTRISDLPLLTSPECRQLTGEWNDTQTDYPYKQCIHRMFEEQVGRTPDRIAAVFEGQEVSYATLNSRANQLAHFLLTAGASADRLVALCIERSIEMLVAIVGVLKSGGAYVPLDPAHPADRLSFMIEDTESFIILSQSWLEPVLPADKRAVWLDTGWDAIAVHRQDNPVTAVIPDHLAYVIYTSGSTGKPKGAMLPHKGVCNRMIWQIQGYPLDQDAIVLQQIPLSFDPSVTEIYPALSCGARLALARHGGQKEGAHIVALIKEQQVSDAFFVPSMLQLFLDTPGVEECVSLRRVESAGEALTLELETRFLGTLNTDLYNFYGPTETSVSMMYYPCGMQETRSVIPLGRPLANVEIYILDGGFDLEPAGIPGELCIGGVPPGRGYLSRPDLTAERYTPNGYGPHPGARLYKSGDLARYLSDGNIEFLGRIDHQIKIRGYRVELGEVEEALASYPGVNECAVVAEDHAGEKRLVSYIVGEGDFRPTSRELHNYMRERLPDYMVPAAFIQVEEMPLTPNGKLDRRALDQVQALQNHDVDDYVAPGNLVEEALASIWEQVLGVEQVGTNDNFFALGGDSILTIRVLTVAHQRGLEISLEDVFQYQTLGELARALTLGTADVSGTEPTAPFSLISGELLDILPDDVEDAYPLSQLQSGMVFHCLYNPESAGAYHEILSVHIKGKIDIESLARAGRGLVRRHPVLRTSFDMTELVQLVRETSEFKMAFEDISSASEEAQEELISQWADRDKQRPFDLSEASLMRLQVHKRAEQSFQLSFSFHHAILDGWSVAVMMMDLLRSYERLRAGSDIREEVSAGRSLFRQFIVLEREALESEASREYWRGKVSGSSPTILGNGNRGARLGRDHRRVKSLKLEMRDEVTKGLKQIARMIGLPLKSVLLAGHLKVLSVLSGEQAVVTGLVSNGRPEEEGADKALGLFLNSLPFAIKMTDGTWRDLIVEVFDAEREMLPHRRYPLAEIQKLNAGQALFDVLFNYVHFHVYDAFQEASDLEVVAGKHHETTNFTMVMNFGRDFETKNIKLDCKYDQTLIEDPQANRIGAYYLRVFESMAASLGAEHHNQVLMPEEEVYQLPGEWADRGGPFTEQTSNKRGARSSDVECV